MVSRLPAIDEEGEVGDLSQIDAALFQAPSKVLPLSLQAKIGMRGAQKTPTKERITIRLSPEVVESFRATGDGWQTRVDAALKDWLKTHSPA